MPALLPAGAHSVEPEVQAPGGGALRFYASVRLELRRGEILFRGGEVPCWTVRATTVKNKIPAAVGLPRALM